MDIVTEQLAVTFALSSDTANARVCLLAPRQQTFDHGADIPADTGSLIPPLVASANTKWNRTTLSDKPGAASS